MEVQALLLGGEAVTDFGLVPAYDVLHAVVHGHEQPAEPLRETPCLRDGDHRLTSPSIP